ncbi:MAG: hypothetical protein RLZZ64_1459 [Bacteroidota bacterium]|jgi:hypothetical protein
MYIAVDALANVDDSKLSYMIFPFDEDLLEAIEENLKEIRIDDELTFPIKDVLLSRGEFHYVRKKVTMTEISEHRFCIARNTDSIPKLQNPKLHVTNDYFYFSGFGKQGAKKDSPAIKFVSENFNIVTIEKLRKYVKSKRDMVN